MASSAATQALLQANLTPMSAASVHAFLQADAAPTNDGPSDKQQHEFLNKVRRGHAFGVSAVHVCLRGICFAQRTLGVRLLPAHSCYVSTANMALFKRVWNTSAPNDWCDI